MNDHERRLWVLNDEYLYRWWKTSRMGILAFIRANRPVLDRHIAAARKGETR